MRTFRRVKTRSDNHLLIAIIALLCLYFLFTASANAQDVPVANDDYLTLDPGDTTFIYVLKNDDFGPNFAGVENFSIKTPSQYGNARRWFSYDYVQYTNTTPTLLDEFEYTVTVRISEPIDVEPYVQTSTVSLSAKVYIAFTNHAPQVVSPLSDLDVYEGESQSIIDVSSAFSDIDGDALTYSAASNNSYASVSMNGSELTIDYQDGAVSETNIAVRATDTNGKSITDTFIVFYVDTIINSYDSVNIDASSILENFPIPFGGDSDVVNIFQLGRTSYNLTNSDDSVSSASFDGNALVLTANALNNQGMSIYTLTASKTFSGFDTFYYKLRETTETKTLRFKVNVLANDAPIVASPITEIDVEENAPPTTIDLSSVFNDPDGDALTYSYTIDTNLYVTPSLNGNNLTLAYRPDTLGSATINVTATDPYGLSVSHSFLATTALTIDTDLTTTKDFSSTVDYLFSLLPSENEILSNPDILDVTAQEGLSAAANSLELSHSIIIARFEQVELGELSKNLQMISSDQTGSVMVTVTANRIYTGTQNHYTFDGRNSVVDGTEPFLSFQSKEVTFKVNVELIRSAPIAVDDAYTVDEDGTISFADILDNDIPDTGYGISLGELDGSNLIGAIEYPLTYNTNGEFNHLAAGETATDSFTYTITDGEFSDTATVTVTIQGQNDAPIAADASYSIAEDQDLVVSLNDFIAGATDPDGDFIHRQIIVATPPANGNVRIAPGGPPYTIDPTDVVVIYTPNYEFSGVDTFTYQVTDGTDTSAPAEVTISVSAVDDAPIALTDEYYMLEDTAIIVPAPGVLANDSDAEGAALSASLVEGASNGLFTFNTDGSFEFVPAADFNGDATATYLASDGGLEIAATIIIHVTPVNDAPTVEGAEFSTNENASLVITTDQLLSTSSDVDGDAIYRFVSLVTPPAHGEITQAPGMPPYTNDPAETILIYSPEPQFNGADSFTFVVTDGTDFSEPAEVVINVTPINDPPIAEMDEYYLLEDNALTVAAPGVLANDVDPEDDPLSVELMPGYDDGRLTLNADGSFAFTPEENFNGEAFYSYRSFDGEFESVASIIFHVTPVNDAPVAMDLSFPIYEDTQLMIPLDSLTIMATDPDGDPVQLNEIIISASPEHGSVSIGSDMPGMPNPAMLNLTYIPEPDFYGEDSFFYQVTDGVDWSEPAEVVIYVSATSDAPVSTPDVYALFEDEVLSVTAPGVLGNDIDVDGDSLSAVLVQGVSDGLFTLNVDGSIEFAPAADFNGSVTATYQADDGDVDTVGNIAPIIISVSPVNDAPSAIVAVTPEAVRYDAGPQSIAGLLANLSAGPFNEASQVLSILTTNSNPELFDLQPQVSLNGTLTYSPADGAVGDADVFVVLQDDGGVSDGGVDSATYSFSLAILDAPATVIVLNAAGVGVSGATVQYKDGSWMDLPGVTDANGEIELPVEWSGRVALRVFYADTLQSQSINLNNTKQVVFQAVNVNVSLVSSSGAPIVGEEAVVEFYQSGWKPFGTTTSGSTSLEMLPNNYRFRMTYANGRSMITQNVGNNASVVFQTWPVSVSLVDSTGAPIATPDSEVLYRGVEWISMGDLSGGVVYDELLPATYRFRVNYASATAEIRQNIKFGPEVKFQTKNVRIELNGSDGNAISGADALVEFNSSGWNNAGEM
ncbi:tandem-95 repeat protein, partial [bacterium]|nr:tandem-95 repeat protein [bacterium]